MRAVIQLNVLINFQSETNPGCLIDLHEICLCKGSEVRWPIDFVIIFNIVITIDTINVVNVKFCMRVVLAELCLFISYHFNDLDCMSVISRSQGQAGQV